MNARTPMLKQYFEAKDSAPDALLAMRVGDFYEFYGTDAETAAKALEITLTAREDGKDNKVAMAGVPHHAAQRYFARLVKMGFRVAVMEQLEDPKKAKGLVKRGVRRILSAGTAIEEEMLDSIQNAFLVAWAEPSASFPNAGLAALDPSTGEFALCEIEGSDWESSLLQEICRLQPRELLHFASQKPRAEALAESLRISVQPVAALDSISAERILREQFKVSQLDGFGCANMQHALIAAASVLRYAAASGLDLGHVHSLAVYSLDEYMLLDESTIRSLELVENQFDRRRNDTLYEVMDRTKTHAGSRLLKQWITRPLVREDAIRKRQDAVEALTRSAFLRQDLQDRLERCADIRRLTSRAGSLMATPRDLLALKATLEVVPDLRACIAPAFTERIAELHDRLHPHDGLYRELESALMSDPPSHTRAGGYIQPKYDSDLDSLREIQSGGRQFIAELEQRERERTGISNLKAGFNSVFGYYLEVPKYAAAKVPNDFVRKQTTANAERYITQELKQKEAEVVGAEERAIALEQQLFEQLQRTVTANVQTLFELSESIAELDVLASLADVATLHRYCKPEFLDAPDLAIRDGRHPVVAAKKMDFVPNDLKLNEAARFIVLTGPNMSGKSTYLRQTALIVLLAQIGSFVPAESCQLGICDRIFARIGARDELASGRSTFMVEMIEAANILNNTTDRSLVILDEIGRGTSTFDGLALAQAIVEATVYVGSRALFATHYHQLNSLADSLPTVKNFRVEVVEHGREVVWTHKVVEGGTDRSYGIQVARMAGVPDEVLERAAELLRAYEESDRVQPPAPKESKLQMSLFEMKPSEVEEALKGLDVDRLSPIDALNWLAQEKAKLADQK
ncbi:MAG: DNA mismatch repair protein MutS [Fimbriimonadaceae bacterium]